MSYILQNDTLYQDVNVNTKVQDLITVGTNLQIQSSTLTNDIANWKDTVLKIKTYMDNNPALAAKVDPSLKQQVVDIYTKL